MKKQLAKILQQTKFFFSKEWQEEYKDFFLEEILVKFSEKLLEYNRNGVPKQLLKPLFKEETTPLLHDSFLPFKEILELFFSDFLDVENIKEEFVKTMNCISFKHILLLLGQRVTSATIQNADGIPPLQADLLIASFQPYNSQVSKVVRAFEKHAERSEDNFWGTITGNPKEKEEKVRIVLTDMLQNKTWWNVFYHYKHELVYEIRVPSGHGARWKKSNLEFIGFVEPFLD